MFSAIIQADNIYEAIKTFHNNNLPSSNRIIAIEDKEFNLISNGVYVS